MSKPRSDSWLKTLSEERQTQVIEWCLKPSDRDDAGKAVPKSGGYDYARAQLASDGITVSVRALSDFYSWYHLHETFARADQKTEDFLELMQAKFPDLSPERIQQFGQAFFTMEATASGNAEEFRAMEKLRLEKGKDQREAEKFQFDKDKFAVATCELFLKWSKDERIRAIEAAPISNAEKIKAMREAAFADVDALQASGQVVIPKA